MSTSPRPIHEDLRSRYRRDGDVDLGAFLAERGITADGALAEAIESDGRIRIELGHTAPLQRYLDAAPGLVGQVTALDAAIEMALRGEQRSGRTLVDAVNSLCRQYPDVEPHIRDATTLSRLIHSGLFTAGRRGAIPGATRTDEEIAERAGPSADSVPGYRLVSEIYRGGQGVVYQAIQESTDRIVAVKVLSGGRFATERERRRFEREIRLAAGLNHPSIVTIHDSGVHDGRHYCAMEYIEGEPLDVYVGRASLSIEETLRLFGRICDAVSYAHERGVVHRDIKPQNILVDPAGVPHLLDFGLAKAVVVTPREAETITTEFIGTLAYASPEQLEGDPGEMDVRTDVYSLGLILFQLVTGRHAYDLDGDFMEVARRILESRPPRPSTLRPELNDDLDTIVLRALARFRERRYQTVDELARDIERVLAGEAIRARHDSTLYLARAHYRSFVHRHVALASILTVLVACVAGQALGIVVLRVLPLTRQFERVMTTWVASPHSLPPLDPVQIIGFSDLGALATFAESNGIDGIDAENVTTLRRLHGHLMDELAVAAPSVVVFDITFEGDTAYDLDFARGVSSLRAAGTDVVISTESWRLDEDSNPPIAGTIFDAGVSWGCASGRFDADEPWRIHLAVKKPHQKPWPALALAAVNAHRDPGAFASIDLDRGARRAVVHASTDSRSANPRARVPAPESATYALTRVSRQVRTDTRIAIDRGDLVGTYVFPVHDDAAFARRTMDYLDVLSMSETERRAAFAGAIVLVGDLRDDIDRHDHPDGRRDVSGVYAHAAAIAGLMAGDAIRYPGWESWFLLAVAAAVAGLVIARLTGSRRRRRLLLLGLGTAVIVLLSAAAYRSIGFLWNPLVPVLAMLIAAQLASAARPVYRTRWR